jgi:hypothetical protein
MEFAIHLDFLNLLSGNLCEALLMICVLILPHIIPDLSC